MAGQQPQKPRRVRRQPLTESQVRMMLTTFLRHEMTFRQVRAQLQPSHFASDQRQLAALWGTVCDYWDKYEALPTPSALFGLMEQWSRSTDLDNRELGELDDLLNEVVQTPAEEVNGQTAAARDVLKQFLEEALQRDLQRQVATGEPIEMPALLESMTSRVQAITSVDIQGVGAPFPDRVEDIPVIQKTSTGCEFFDKYLNGGQAPQEVYGLCAPYGVCKTLLAVQLSVNRARHEQSLFKKTKGKYPLPLVYVVFYEEEYASVMARALSYAAKVDKTTIEEGRYAQMSSVTRGDYKPYERRLFADALAEGKPVAGEIERINSAKAMMNRNLRFIDFTGTRADYREAAANGVQGIEAVIEQDQLLNGNPGVSMVSLDYAGAAADRHCEHYNLDTTKHTRNLVGRMPLRLKNRIAVRYNCPVWCYHQLNTEANSRQCGIAPKITDIADARNFLENCSFGFLIGTKSRDDMVVMVNRKQRRAKQQDETILRIEGHLARVVGTGSMYRLDRGQIIKASEYNRMAMLDAELESEEEERQGPVSDLVSLPATGRKKF